ncbi:MAG: hypothetical protein EPN91_08400 [Salinibacterium sp.]|nr:MAG: hypothetical protein EPN91_08400 [Salinibacterium sp.]
MPTIERESGLNLPNVMTPGAWVIVAVVLTAIALGVGAMVWQLWSSRVKWQPLGFMGVQYFAVNGCVSAERLTAAVDKARAFLILTGKWSTAQTDKALGGFNIYVFDHETEAGKPGISGSQLGNVVNVNRRLTTLCHEMGHLLQERIEGIVDHNHVRWETDGFVKAERAYSDWLNG